MSMKENCKKKLTYTDGSTTRCAGQLVFYKGTIAFTPYISILYMYLCLHMLVY